MSNESKSLEKATYGSQLTHPLGEHVNFMGQKHQIVGVNRKTKFYTLKKPNGEKISHSFAAVHMDHAPSFSKHLIEKIKLLKCMIKVLNEKN